jgi:hypothetical protein
MIGFTLVMRGLYGLMKVTALRSDRFREKLSEKDIGITMTTRQRDVARTFVFRNGGVDYEKGVSPESAVSLVWDDARKGRAIMVNMAKGQRRALMDAVINRDLQLEGDAAGIKWFLDVITLLSKMYRKKKTVSSVPAA